MRTSPPFGRGDRDFKKLQEGGIEKTSRKGEWQEGGMGQKWPNYGQILAKKSQILAISEFSQHQHYVFPEEDHKLCFYNKKYENL